MNVLMFNFEYPPLGGGGGIATRDLAECLAARHAVHVITTGFQHLPPDEVRAGVHVHRVPVLGRRSLPTASLLSLITYIPSAWWRSQRLLREVSFDVVHAQFVLPSGLPAAAVARLNAIPLVITFVGGDLYDPTKGISPHRHWWLRLIVRNLAGWADTLTAISSDTRSRAQRLHGVTQPITVVPIGLRVPAWRPVNRGALTLPDAFVFISIGRLIPRKRYDVLINVWRHVPGAHLLIIGTGPQRSLLEHLIARFGLGNRVRLLGAVSEERKWQLLSVSDAYVSAAEHEGFGLVFLEAMYVGLPIVATNRGGQTDFLRDRQNALLVPVHDPTRLVEALKTVMSDAPLRQAMSEANRQAVAPYRLERTAALYEAVLQQAVTEFRRSR